MVLCIQNNQRLQLFDGIFSFIGYIRTACTSIQLLNFRNEETNTLLEVPHAKHSCAFRQKLKIVCILQLVLCTTRLSIVFSSSACLSASHLNCLLYSQYHARVSILPETLIQAFHRFCLPFLSLLFFLYLVLNINEPMSQHVLFSEF